jgi:hypothetical protein
MLGQENLKRVQLLRDTLDVVEAVNTNDELHALELLLESRDALLDLGLLETLVELLRVDTDRKCANRNDLSVVLDAVGGGGQAPSLSVTVNHSTARDLQDTRAAAEEVARIVVGVEADQVALEHTAEDLVSDGEDAVDLGAGEGCVQEEADLDVLLGVANLLAQHLGHEHEVVVVHPDHVVVLHVLRDRLGEQAVGLHVCLPGRLVEGNLTGVVVEERPHDGICECVSRLQLLGISLGLT